MPKTVVILLAILALALLFGSAISPALVPFLGASSVCGAWALNCRTGRRRALWTICSLASGLFAGLVVYHSLPVTPILVRAFGTATAVFLPGILGAALARWNRLQMLRHAQDKAARTFYA